MMSEEEVKVVIGGLLHDIGKVVRRSDGKIPNHSQRGYEYLKDEIGIEDISVLNSVLYHHADLLQNANIKENDIAYIVYVADNIASAVDRRTLHDEKAFGFEWNMPLQSVFNILNGNDQMKYYKPKQLNIYDGMNVPSEGKVSFTRDIYTNIIDSISRNLKSKNWTQTYINSLLEVLEATLTYVPSSTAVGERADVSLYDHVKMTAAVASCIYQYLEENEITNFKKKLYTDETKFRKENVFCLYAMDLSNIKEFIYTITTKKALKTLRARSFYVEILMEHIIDDLLEKLHLSRANLIYNGGGHCYILVSNTEVTMDLIERYIENVNQWFLEQYKIQLHLVDAIVKCSCEQLRNNPEGSYADLFRELDRQLEKKRYSRYRAKDILYLNKDSNMDYTRECKVCKTIGNISKKNTDEDYICDICKSLEDFSDKIVEDEFFTIVINRGQEGIILPNNCVLVSDNKESIEERIKSDDCFVRTYSKNNMYANFATKLWVGDYSVGKTMEELAQLSQGVKRVGILMMNIDNLQEAFIDGFHEKFKTLSRTATFSRQLSLFLKFYINQILERGRYQLGRENNLKRNASIVYSSGDDIFIMGAWNEMIELAMDIYNEFEEYTQNTLTISAGIGIYAAGYPISVMASEVEELLSKSKDLQNKNGITLFDGYTYTWEEFQDEVINQKFNTIQEFLDFDEEKGNAFLYRLLELIRERTKKINFARYVYVLARMEPQEDDSIEKKMAYEKFSKKMYQWIKNDEDCKQLETAITLYVYLNRKNGETEDGRN